MDPEAEIRENREYLRPIEERWQKFWAENHTFEEDAPKDKDQEKFMVTFPYPYMNGRLHLGHLFSLTKAEFAAGYRRMTGANVLFPFGLHCTGSPICAAAEKLRREIEVYGNPPVFPSAEELEAKHRAAQEAKAQKEADKIVDLSKGFKGKKTKVAQKGGAAAFQWKIMESLGISAEEIPKFVDPMYWVEYFPKHCVADLKKFGARIDWRRSFVTTDQNPYYDSFIRWQFNQLKAADKIKFGKRYSIFSPIDKQACADHERASGEGVGPQEYTIIKMRVVNEEGCKVPEAIRGAIDSGLTVSLGAATLRPETMYGQTNCWALPGAEYVVAQINDKEALVVSQRAAENLAHQELTSGDFGVPTILGTVSGDDLLGVTLQAPLCDHTVPVLPLLTISMTKGTGVVTSVPADAPDDFIALRDLQQSEEMCAKYGIDHAVVSDIKVIPLIKVPVRSGDFEGKYKEDDFMCEKSAEFACDLLKIHNQHDRNKLKQAKEFCYTRGFYEGVMIVGKYVGESIAEAKNLVKDDLMKTGEAIPYAEPEDVVIARSGCECVVALLDQWYLDYGEDEWKSMVKRMIDEKMVSTPDVKKWLHQNVDWLSKWACSRQFGLGTRLPWDEQWLIESLSDSTIYMAFYTVAALLQGNDNLDGRQQPSPGGIQAEDMNDDVWTYVLRHGAYPEGTKIPRESLERLREEFEYWYPVDLRVSGRDLMKNHLIMFMYNHAAVWADDDTKWPRNIRPNGFLNLDNKKMSKSTGNFFTCVDAIERYGADIVRLGLADSGDSAEDGNFTTEGVRNLQTRMVANDQWIKETMAEYRKAVAAGDVDFLARDKIISKLFTKEEITEEELSIIRDTLTIADEVFFAGINEVVERCTNAYENFLFREATIYGWRELMNVRERYRALTQKTDLSLMAKFIELSALLIAPVCPHIAEEWWADAGHDQTVCKASFPVVDFRAVSEDTCELANVKYNYLENFMRGVRQNIEFNLSKNRVSTVTLPEDATLIESITFTAADDEVCALCNCTGHQRRMCPQHLEITPCPICNKKDHKLGECDKRRMIKTVFLKYSDVHFDWMVTLVNLMKESWDEEACTFAKTMMRDIAKTNFPVPEARANDKKYARTIKNQATRNSVGIRDTVVAAAEAAFERLGGDKQTVMKDAAMKALDDAVRIRFDESALLQSVASYLSKNIGQFIPYLHDVSELRVYVGRDLEKQQPEKPGVEIEFSKC